MDATRRLATIRPIDSLPAMPNELDFIAEYSRCENEVYRFILTLVPHRPDADELLQDTAKAMWTKYFQTNEPIRSFKSWACQIAFYEVLRFRRAKARQKMMFSQEVVEQLAAVRRNHDDLLAKRRLALSDCLKKLPWSDIELLRTRYGIEIETALESTVPSSQPITNAMSKRLQRVRRILMHCIAKQLSTGAV